MPTYARTSRLTWTLTILSALLVIACLAIPMYVIRPFVPQDARQLGIALAVRRAAPWISSLCLVVAGFILIRGWRDASLAGRISCALLFLVTAGGALLTHVNLFEVMFKPYGASSFEPISSAKVDADDRVLAVTLNGESHAFPIRTMGYHHIVNDEISGQPIAATYCTLCHTGLVWSRRMIIPVRMASSCDCTLTFRLAGINNGNALLRDEETDSIWQQSTGEAIFGPLKGRHLALVHSDELSFALWSAEQPRGLVLKPEAQYVAEYDPKDWDTRVLRYRTVVDTSRSGIAPHELMLGIQLFPDSAAKAYPLKSVLNAGLIEDRVGDKPVVIAVGNDRTSIRAFEASLPNEAVALTFVGVSTPEAGALMTDVESHSVWNFQGYAISGPYQGRQLKSVDSHKDFWFDWLSHHPASTVFRN